MDELLIVITTVPDAAIAQTIGEVLVTEGYAACVQIIGGVSSTYRWQGKVCHAPEQILLIKTMGNGYVALEPKLRAIHPYSEPEIFAIKAAQVSSSYLQWVKGALVENSSDAGH